jgi:hypothetical protein
MARNYPHAVVSRDELTSIAEKPQQPDSRFAVRLFGFVGQVYCGLHGHDNLLHFEGDRLCLKCVSCGHESAGWELDEAPPRVTVRPDRRRRAQVPPQLTRERRIA